MTRKVNIMTNVVKGDQVKDSYGMGRFDFDSYFRRADEPMTDDMPRPMGIDEEDFDEDEEEEE